MILQYSASCTILAEPLIVTILLQLTVIQFGKDFQHALFLSTLGSVIIIVTINKFLDMVLFLKYI